MRLYFASLLLVSFGVNGQLIERTRSELTDIRTVEQANEYLAKQGSVSGQILELNARTDTTAMDKDIISGGKGDLIEFESDDKKTHYFFKTLETGQVKSFRVQYIFLDNGKLNMAKIDSLRKVIFRRIEKGEAFDRLVREYSMDGNSQKGGDLGWFQEGMMMAEFEEKVRSKRTGEIFTVDIPTQKWYYVVKNSHDPRLDKKVTVLYVEVKSSN